MSEILADWLGPCLPLAWERLSRFEWQEEARPAEFRCRTLTGGTSSFQLTSRGWTEVGRRLNVKWSRIRGAALDIATLICYPTNHPDSLPIYAFEWVVIGGRGHAMICDVEVCDNQSPLAGRVDEVFAAEGVAFQAQFGSLEKPEWFQDIARPHAQFFAIDVENLPSVWKLQDRFLELAVESFYDVEMPGLLGGDDHQAVTDYKVHHATHSPGTKILTKSLGAEECRRFLFDYHFGPALGPV